MSEYLNMNSFEEMYDNFDYNELNEIEQDIFCNLKDAFVLYINLHIYHRKDLKEYYYKIINDNNQYYELHEVYFNLFRYCKTFGFGDDDDGIGISDGFDGINTDYKELYDLLKIIFIRNKDKIFDLFPYGIDVIELYNYMYNEFEIYKENIYEYLIYKMIDDCIKIDLDDETMCELIVPRNVISDEIEKFIFNDINYDEKYMEYVRKNQFEIKHNIIKYLDKIGYIKKKF